LVQQLSAELRSADFALLDVALEHRRGGLDWNSWQPPEASRGIAALKRRVNKESNTVLYLF
jgi:hypothetical protein